MKQNHQIGNIIPLTDKRRNSVASDEAKLAAMMELVVERSNNKVLGEMRAITSKLEKAVHRLLENIEGVVTGETEIAVAGVVDGAQDDLPSVSRLKAEPTLIYNLRTGQIAAALGLSTMRVSYLLNKDGLDWVHRKPELWGKDLYRVSNTRLWHSKTIELLREVLDDPAHDERSRATPSCQRFLLRLDEERRIS